MIRYHWPHVTCLKLHNDHWNQKQKSWRYQLHYHSRVSSHLPRKSDWIFACFDSLKWQLCKAVRSWRNFHQAVCVLRASLLYCFFPTFFVAALVVKNSSIKKKKKKKKKKKGNRLGNKKTKTQKQSALLNNRVLRLPAIVLLNTTFRPGNSGPLRVQ